MTSTAGAVWDRLSLARSCCSSGVISRSGSLLRREMAASLG
ncbi:hypothetical protein [Singulisphaera acidiphila]|nr:hypothetical protein [Singulisphaera acidiphila]